MPVPGQTIPCGQVVKRRDKDRSRAPVLDQQPCGHASNLKVVDDDLIAQEIGMIPDDEDTGGAPRIKVLEERKGEVSGRLDDDDVGAEVQEARESAHRLVIAIPVQADGRDPTFRLPCHGERVDEVLVKRCEQVCQEDSDRLDPGGDFRPGLERRCRFLPRAQPNLPRAAALTLAAAYCG